MPVIVEGDRGTCCRGWLVLLHPADRPVFRVTMQLGKDQGGGFNGCSALSAVSSPLTSQLYLLCTNS